METRKDACKLAVQILRFVDEHQPGFVECEFEDVEGRRHRIIEKIPVLTAERLWSDSDYPVPGTMPCLVLDRRTDARGREVVQITTEYPRHRRCEEGLAEFTVLSSQVSTDRPPRDEPRGWRVYEGGSGR
jgi:hypothetical protein